MRHASHAAAAAIVAVSALASLGTPSTVAQDATPGPALTCASVGAPSAAGSAGTMPGGPGMAGGNAPAGQNRPFDEAYIDMMIPHHASIIALAEVARGRLTDPRLVQIANDIVSSQQGEIATLRADGAKWYGSPDAMPMGGDVLGMLGMAGMTGNAGGSGMMGNAGGSGMMGNAGGSGMMGNAGAQEPEAMKLMDARALVAEFCAAENPDLAFIDLAIPHHQMAITASEAALKEATHEEIRAIAREVIAAQQREIDEMRAIRAELTGAATPAGS